MRGPTYDVDTFFAPTLHLCDDIAEGLRISPGVRNAPVYPNVGQCSVAWGAPHNLGSESQRIELCDRHVVFPKGIVSAPNAVFVVDKDGGSDHRYSVVGGSIQGPNSTEGFVCRIAANNDFRAARWPQIQIRVRPPLTIWRNWL